MVATRELTTDSTDAGGDEPTPPAGEPIIVPRRRPIRTIAGLVALALASGTVGAAGVTFARGNPESRPSLAAQSPAASTAPAPSTSDTPTVPPPATATGGRRGVVEISTTLAFGTGRGAGTGILLKPTGEVLTNSHVIEGTSSISVQINGTGRVYKATVVGTDSTHDIALLRLENASGLATAETADSSTLDIGDAVTAIGNALGQAGPPTMATGVVTALNQSITAGDRSSGGAEALRGLIQTDVPLQPGDSGGPLLNDRSQVVGINTAASVGRRALGGEREAFAIPIERALAIVADIRAGRSSSTVRIGSPAFLGVGLAEAATIAGAGVIDVEDGTPAAAVGLKAGDTIVALDNKAVTSAQSLRALLDVWKPGDRVSIAWLDARGQRHTANVNLAAGPPR